jgi:hypothetical protein
VIVSAFVSVVVTGDVVVAVSKLFPREIVAVNEHVPADCTALIVLDVMVQESDVLVRYETVPSKEPAEGVAITVLVSPYLRGEVGAVIEIVRVARLIVIVEVTRVTAV